MACAIKKGMNYECAHSHLGEVRSSHQGPRLPPPSRINGAYLPGLWLPEMVGLRGTGPDPVYQQRPADFLDVPCLRHPRGQLVPWRSEWLFGALLFLGFWNKRLGILGAIGSTITFVGTVTIIPFMPNGWDPAAGFPAMAGNVPFLMKDVVLLAVSIYLLKQDVVRVLEADPSASVALSRA